MLIAGAKGTSNLHGCLYLISHTNPPSLCTHPSHWPGPLSRLHLDNQISFEIRPHSSSPVHTGSACPPRVKSSSKAHRSVLRARSLITSSRFPSQILCTPLSYSPLLPPTHTGEVYKYIIHHLFLCSKAAIDAPTSEDQAWWNRW